ncbi:MAG TPA: hypothetical protein VG433_03550, partial [Pirellulales bacterium]|nr:hypothetical protein [Pirellulales bacterium]
DRKAIAWVLSIGGKVLSWEAGKPSGITRPDAPLPKVPALQFDLQQLESVNDESLSHLANVKDLNVINLSHSRITSAGIARLGAVGGLWHLYIYDNPQLDNAAAERLGELKQLKGLNLNGSTVGDEGLDALDGLVNLQYLVLRGTRVTEARAKQFRTSHPNCRVDWAASATTASVAQAAPSKPAAAQPASEPGKSRERLPVPEGPALEQARKTVKDVYGDEINQARQPDEKAALAKKLIEQGEQTQDNPAAQYALLDQARQLAIAAADMKRIEWSVAAISQRFQLAADTAMADAWNEVSQKSRTPAASKTVAEAALARASTAASREHYDAAKQLADVALRAARKAKDPALIKQVNERSKAINALVEQSLAADNARKTLEKQPDDPEANRVLGRYECLVLDNWAEGFRHLAKSGDSVERELAARSVSTPPDDAAAATAMADAWYDAAHKAKGTQRAFLQDAASYWYSTSLPGLSSLEKARAEKRLAELRGGGKTGADGAAELTRKVPAA